MVYDPLAPGAAEDRIAAARKYDLILDRNHTLVVIAIERPGLQLAAREFALVHQQVKRMSMVITLIADFAQGGAQLVHRQTRRFHFYKLS